MVRIVIMMVRIVTRKVRIVPILARIFTRIVGIDTRMVILVTKIVTRTNLSLVKKMIIGTLKDVSWNRCYLVTKKSTTCRKSLSYKAGNNVCELET